MPNQMMPKVNLLKMPDPATQTAKYVNMMNMAKQQEAAERQAQMAQETLTLQQQKGAREEALQAPVLAKAKTEAEVAQLDYVMKFFKSTANDLANSTTPEQAVARGERLKQQFPDPALQKRIDETIADLVSDPSQFEAKRKTIILRTLDAKDQFAETHSDIFDADGNLYNKKTSPVGAFPTEITPGVVTGPPVTGAAPAAPPRATPAPSSGAPMRATQGANTTPRDLMQQGMDPRNIPSGMPTSPASFNSGSMGTSTAGQMTPDMVPAILDSAVNTGVMAQIDLDQMLALAPPQARQGIMDVIRSNNINLQADAPSLATSGMAQQQPMAPNPVQRPQSQFADMRGPAPQSQTAGLDGAPPMQNTMAQYQVGQQIKGKNPSVSPLPGSSQVPLSRVKAEADMRRETPEQIKARKAAELQATEDFEEANKDKRLGRKRQEVFEGERAKKDAEFLETYSDATTKSRTTLNVIDQMIGDAQIEKGSLVVPRGGRAPHPGFEGVVGLGVPGVRFFPGTAAASFDALFEQAEGGAFLKAFNDLRGGGSITVTEGDKATSALTRMKRSQSEVEFVRAAREFADVLRTGIERANKKYTKLTGEAPEAAPARRKTPTKSNGGWGKAKVVGN